MLITGGIGANGVVTSSCDIYDPATDTMSPTGSMIAPRCGHGLSVLLNGKVLVTGGLADYQNATTALVTALNTAQNTAELYDPATGIWTPVPGTMSVNRAGHSQTILGNGLVLLAGGMTGGFVNGGLWGSVQLPVMTTSCEFYDPQTNSISPANPMSVARAFHGASHLGNGDLLVSGGMVSSTSSGTVGATPSCERFNGSDWIGVGPLPIGVAFHTQFISPTTGKAVIQGGLAGNFGSPVGSAQAGEHDGAAFALLGNALGQNTLLSDHSPTFRGLHSATQLYDGSYLILGGAAGPNPLGTGYVYYAN